MAFGLARQNGFSDSTRGCQRQNCLKQLLTQTELKKPLRLLDGTLAIWTSNCENDPIRTAYSVVIQDVIGCRWIDVATLYTKPANFQRFGPSILAQSMRGRHKRINIPEDRLEARRILRDSCPKVPGVYGWLDQNRQLVYVGKSKCLRKRLLSYFAKNPADDKTDRIRQHSSYIVWEPISHELLALLREQELIHRWRPEFNSMGQPTRMQPAFLCIGGSPAPNARLARRLTGKYSHAFGPIAGTKHLREAIVSINQVFKLRDCPDKTKFEYKSQQLLFDDESTAKCIRYELGTCPAPCAAICTAGHYLDQVEQCLAFLNGNNKTTLLSIQNKMTAAAERQAFESASIYRDCLKNLKWLDRKLFGLRMAEENLNGVLKLPARRNRHAWLILRGGRIVESMLQPDAPENAEIALEKITHLENQAPDLPASLLEMSLQLIVIAWFRKYPIIKEQLLSFGEASQYCHSVCADTIQWKRPA